MSNVIANAPRVFIARQPILDKTGRVFGYELLHRDSPSATLQRSESDQRATARVLTDGLLSIGFDALTGGRRALINVSRQFLLDGVPPVLPPGAVTLGLGADVVPDSAVIEACDGLRNAGYSLAIDHFTLEGGNDELLALVDYVRIDFSRASTTAARARLLPAGVPADIALVATRLDTAAQFQEALAEGYQFFQGGFFGRPVIKEGRTIPAHQITQLRLLHALNDPNLSVHQIAELIKPDPSMCYRVLRAVNSAQFALQKEVASISEALILLGRDTVKRWVSLWSLAALGDKSHPELLTTATVRARCCEQLGDTTGRDDIAAQGFLLGLCSMLDAILERPMPDIVTELPLPVTIRAALLGEDNKLRRLLGCALAYEKGEWDDAVELAEAAGVDPSALPATYSGALQWARDLDRLTRESAA
jgi:EAL and modified HD-GYP domain-containing signal transduction protein